MSERMEWRTVYGNKQVLFADDISMGDFYPVEGGVYRVRLFREDRLEAERARLVLTEDAARSLLVAMLERARREAGEA
jgi:hypothetical protein